MLLTNEMEIFCAVVETGSFAKAAQRLKVSPSFITKRINKLEEFCAQRLITRSTRNLSITAEGRQFYQHCRDIVHQAEHAFAELNQQQVELRGILKVSAPPAYAQYVLSKLIPIYCADNKQVNIDLHLSSNLIDVIKEGYDLVIRSAKLKDSNLIARKIQTIKQVLCASNDYIKQYGMPKTLEDLKHHKFGLYNNNLKSRIVTANGKSISINGCIFCSQIEFLKLMVQHHQCMALLPEFMVNQAIHNNEIVPCLSEFTFESQELYVIYPQRKYMQHKVKRFVDLLLLEPNTP